MYFWLLQKMLTNCRSEVNGNFNSLVRNSGLSFSLFLEEMLLLLHTPSSTVGFPTVGRSVRCSNAFSCSQAGVPSGYAPYSVQNLLFSFCLRKSNEAFIFLKESGKSHFICNVYLCTGGAVTITCCAGKVLVSLTPPVPSMWMGTFQREIFLPSAQRFCGGGGYLEMLVENIPVLFNCLAWWVLCAGHLSSQGCSQAWQCIPFLLGRLWAVLQFLSCVAWGEGGRRSHSVQCKYSLRAEGQDLLCKLLIIPHLQTPVVLYYSPDCYGLLQSFLNDLFCVVWPLAEQVFSLVWLWSEYFCSMAASSA